MNPAPKRIQEKDGAAAAPVCGFVPGDRNAARTSAAPVIAATQLFHPIPKLVVRNPVQPEPPGDPRQRHKNRREDGPDPDLGDQKEDVGLEPARRPVEEELEPRVVEDVPDPEGDDEGEQAVPRAIGRDPGDRAEHDERHRLAEHLDPEHRRIHLDQREAESARVVDSPEIDDDDRLEDPHRRGVDTDGDRMAHRSDLLPR